MYEHISIARPVSFSISNNLKKVTQTPLQSQKMNLIICTENKKKSNIISYLFPKRLTLTFKYEVIDRIFNLSEFSQG